MNALQIVSPVQVRPLSVDCGHRIIHQTVQYSEFDSVGVVLWRCADCCMLSKSGAPFLSRLFCVDLPGVSGS